MLGVMMEHKFAQESLTKLKVRIRNTRVVWTTERIHSVCMISKSEQLKNPKYCVLQSVDCTISDSLAYNSVYKLLPVWGGQICPSSSALTLFSLIMNETSHSSLPNHCLVPKKSNQYVTIYGDLVVITVLWQIWISQTLKKVIEAFIHVRGGGSKQLDSRWRIETYTAKNELTIKYATGGRLAN